MTMRLWLVDPLSSLTKMIIEYNITYRPKQVGRIGVARNLCWGTDSRGAVYRSRNRDAEGVEEGRVWEGRVPLPSRLEHLGECRELPGRKGILVQAYLSLEGTHLIATNLTFLDIFGAHNYLVTFTFTIIDKHKTLSLLQQRKWLWYFFQYHGA